MIAYRLSAGLSPVEWSPASEELWAAAEAASGETLDRQHPRLRFESPGGGSDQSQGPTRLFVTDRIPVRAAHAGRFREVIQALRLCGVEAVVRKGKGSHVILRNA